MRENLEHLPPVHPMKPAGQCLLAWILALIIPCQWIIDLIFHHHCERCLVVSVLPDSRCFAVVALVPLLCVSHVFIRLFVLDIIQQQ